MSQDPEGSPACFFVSLDDYHYFFNKTGSQADITFIPSRFNMDSETGFVIRQCSKGDEQPHNMDRILLSVCEACFGLNMVLTTPYLAFKDQKQPT